VKQIPIVEKLEERSEANGDMLINPDGPEAAAIIEELVEALEEARGVLADTPAPHSFPLWGRICRAIQSAENALTRAQVQP
jgi:hypothetical protein